MCNRRLRPRHQAADRHGPDVPDAGRIGGVTMLARTADLAKDAKLKVAPVVQARSSFIARCRTVALWTR